jgi:hypothetical protein
MKNVIAAAAALLLLAGAAAAQDPSLTAKLVDAENKALKKSATVEVKVAGVKIVDPSSVNEKPVKGQGHLHYQIDDGPVIATTATKLSFHGLNSGKREIKVMLAANDHLALGPTQILEVTVP